MHGCVCVWCECVDWRMNIFIEILCMRDKWLVEIKYTNKLYHLRWAHVYVYIVKYRFFFFDVYNNNNEKSTQARCVCFASIQYTYILYNILLFTEMHVCWCFFFATVWCLWSETLRWWTINCPLLTNTILHAVLSLSDGVNFSKPFSGSARFSVL